MSDIEGDLSLRQLCRMTAVRELQKTGLPGELAAKIADQVAPWVHAAVLTMAGAPRPYIHFVMFSADAERNIACGTAKDCAEALEKEPVGGWIVVKPEAIARCLATAFIDVDRLPHMNSLAGAV